MIKRNPFGIFISLLLVLALSGMATARAAGPQTPEASVGASFTYQGRLIDGGAPASGAYDLRFSLYDAESGGAPVSSMLARDEVTASDGYFTVALDFGAAFDGTATWLEVEVRPGASAGSYTVLAPRTPLAGVPYALGLTPGAVVKTSEVNVPAITVSAPFSNSNALVATGTGDGYAVVFAEDHSSAGGYALFGKSSAGAGYGVYGSTNPGGYGVVGSNGGSNSSGYAGSFNGRVAVAGTLSKGGGSFKIDHPLDPANKYLSHSFVESPDMLNIYNGTITTGADGFATVTLPDWFEALNRDFRYQLTVIGQFAQAIVAEEIRGNQFRIQTDKPEVKVSWQVTGIRHDPFADAYRIPVEEEKTGDERGRYLYPDVYGKSVQESIWYASSPNVRYMIDHPEARERLEPNALRSDAPSPAQPAGQ